jgi:hypothetical protein
VVIAVCTLLLSITLAALIFASAYLDTGAVASLGYSALVLGVWLEFMVDLAHEDWCDGEEGEDGCEGELCWHFKCFWLVSNGVLLRKVFGKRKERQNLHELHFDEM